MSLECCITIGEDLDVECFRGMEDVHKVIVEQAIIHYEEPYDIDGGRVKLSGHFIRRLIKHLLHLCSLQEKTKDSVMSQYTYVLSVLFTLRSSNRPSIMNDNMFYTWY